MIQKYSIRQLIHKAAGVIAFFSTIWFFVLMQLMIFRRAVSDSFIGNELTFFVFFSLAMWVLFASTAE